MQAGWFATGFVTAWGWATWWTVSSNKTFFGKFIGTPRITRGYKPFTSLVNPTQVTRKTKSKKRKQ
jgi:hypothetical protein